MPRRLLAAGLATLVCLQAACTVPVRPDHLAQPDKRSLGRVAIVAARFQPEYRFNALVSGHDASAGRGAVEGMTGCVEFLRVGAIGVLFMMFCVPIAAIVGAASGAAAAAPAEQVDAANRSARQVIEPLDLQNMVLAAVERYAKETGLDVVRIPEPAGPATPAEEPLYAQSKGFADTILEVSVMEAMAAPIGPKAVRFGLGMQVRVRVVGVRDGKEMDRLIARTGGSLTPEAWFADAGGSRSPEEWLADDGKAIRPAFERSAALAAEQALDEILLIYHPAVTVDWPSPGETERVPPYALRAIEPPIRNKVYDRGHRTFGNLERYPLDSLQPEFRWEAWPRGFDIAPGVGPGQAQDVRYDLRIMGASGVAYERLGLRDSAHRLEQTLEPCGLYRWTVRARFVLNDAPRATEWTGAYDRMWGSQIAPWWFRRGRAANVGNPKWYFPIVETPSTSGDACPGRW